MEMNKDYKNYFNTKFINDESNRNRIKKLKCENRSKTYIFKRSSTFYCENQNLLGSAGTEAENNIEIKNIPINNPNNLISSEKLTKNNIDKENNPLNHDLVVILVRGRNISF